MATNTNILADKIQINNNDGNVTEFGLDYIDVNHNEVHGVINIKPILVDSMTEVNLNGATEYTLPNMEVGTARQFYFKNTENYWILYPGTDYSSEFESNGYICMYTNREEDGRAYNAVFFNGNWFNINSPNEIYDSDYVHFTLSNSGNGYDFPEIAKRIRLFVYRAF